MLQGMYEQALQLHVAALALVISLSAVFLLFILRPAYLSGLAESKRIAQLLATLPPEYDIEGLLASTLNISSSSPLDPQTQLEGAARVREAARNMTGFGLRKGVKGM
jgi:hypothetical protein